MNKHVFYKRILVNGKIFKKRCIGDRIYVHNDNLTLVIYYDKEDRSFTESITGLKCLPNNFKGTKDAKLQFIKDNFKLIYELAYGLLETDNIVGIYPLYSEVDDE